MVDHDREVLVVTFVGDLIDPEPTQTGEPILGGVDIGPHPGDDRPDGSPGNPHQLRDRGLGALRRQPSDLLVEAAGMTRTVPGPRHRRHGDPVRDASNSRCLGLQPDRDGAQVQTPPSPSTLTVVIPRSSLSAQPAPSARVSFWSHMSDQDPLERIKVQLLDDRLLNPQQSTP
jgi:hypothetical protein